MPIYEYACESCGHRFEKLVRMSDDAPPCPECEGAVRKLISASSFVLKGGGWYKDGYGSSAPGGGSSSSSSSEG
ncbi:MAG: zinc ribbon domain-containing protein [Proteobacteria bacterium]|nr:zinc ribbon domain-containing protein [Pseudomonadota bacterium]